MDVRSIEDVAPVVEHNGTVPVWWLVNPREMKDITDGGYLELVSEFEVAGGGLVDPHSHPTHEFYYVTAGPGIMMIDGEEREISQGDLVHIPPNLVHSLRPVSDHAPIHCFCFAVGVAGRRPGRLHGPLAAWPAVLVTRRLPDGGLDPLARRGPRARAARRRHAVHARRAGRRGRATSTRSCACSPTASTPTCSRPAAAGCGSSRTSRSATTTSTSPRRTGSASRCATRPACSTRPPPTSRSC